MYPIGISTQASPIHSRSPFQVCEPDKNFPLRLHMFAYRRNNYEPSSPRTRAGRRKTTYTRYDTAARGLPFAVPGEWTRAGGSTVSLLTDVKRRQQLTSERRSLGAQLALKKENKLTAQTVSIEEREISLRRKLRVWFEIQRIYMPCVDAVRPQTVRPQNSVSDALPDDVESISAVDMELYLPHSLDERLRAQVSQGLLRKYQRLRFAQAEDALGAMKRSLRKGATLFDHQTRHTAGTGVAANTRMNTAIQRQNAKTRLDAARYRAAREALLVLDPLGTWKNRLQVLQEADVRPPPRDRTKKNGVSEGRKTMTWIWKVPRASEAEREGGQDEDEEAVRIGDDAVETAEANDGL